MAQVTGLLSSNLRRSLTIERLVGNQSTLKGEDGADDPPSFGQAHQIQEMGLTPSPNDPDCFHACHIMGRCQHRDLVH